MFFESLNFERNSAKKRYLDEVERYLGKNSFILVQRLYTKGVGTVSIKANQVIGVLVEDYPKAPWIKNGNYLSHFVAIFETLGYTFDINDNGDVSFNIDSLCKTIIKEYLNKNITQIINRLSEACEVTKGKITYIHMIRILGFRVYIDTTYNETTMKYCVSKFLEQMSLPFRKSETHVYFP